MFRDSRRVRPLLGLMILTSITLITIDYRAGANSPFRGLRRSAGTFFGPMERGVSSALRPIGNALSTLGNVGNLDSEVKKLRAERAAVQGQQRTNDDKERLYTDAEKLLKLTDAGQYRFIAAHVIGAAPSNFSWTVTIDAGTDRGVRKDQTVLNVDGLVGRVITPSKYTSIVLLAIDLKSIVGARLAYSNTRGMVKGNGPGQLTFEVTPSDAEVSPRQPVTTAGPTLVPGVPIGEAVESRAAPGAISRSIIVKPYVNFSHLDLVGVVIQQERKTDLDVLVPANPRPTPTTPAVPQCSPATTPAAAPTGGSASPSLQPAVPTQSWVPCLSSEPPQAGGSAAAPSPAPSP